MWQAIESKFASFFLQSGGMLILLGNCVKEFRLGKRDIFRLLKQMMVIGWQTLPLAFLIGIFTGMIVALGTGFVLQQYNQEVLIADVVAQSMVRHMAPVFTAFIIAARVGAAMTAELGTMSVSEELDVLRVLSIRIDRFLIMPRIAAALTMTPLLTVYSMIVGLIGGAVVSNSIFGVSLTIYKNQTFESLEPDEILKGLLKTVVFGAIYSTVCCFKGITTTGGAQGVGRSTTSAIVISLSGILIAEYILTYFMF